MAFRRGARGRPLLIPTASAQAAGFVVHLTAPTHHPKVGKHWKITVTAMRKGSGKPVNGAAPYEFLYGGAVVSKRYPAPQGGPAKAPYHFKGRFTDTLTFPKRSVGEPLTFRVVVRAGPLGTARADYPIRVEDRGASRRARGPGRGPRGASGLYAPRRRDR